jgi:hypothetical protein
MATPIEFEGSCSPACGVVTTKLGESTTASPVTGTIARWRVNGATETEGYELNVVRRNSGGTFTVTASSGSVTPAGNQIETFATNLPITAGEFIELNLPDEGGIALFETPSTEALFEPGLSPGETRAPEEFEGGTESSGDIAVGYNADVEYVRTPAPTPVVPAPVLIPLTPAPAQAHCVVPKLEGKKLKAAKKMLRAADCKVGHVAKEAGVKATTGKVVKQAPKSRKVLPARTAVSVKLG